ncbi:MAG: hypothetical protein WBL31_05080 [Ilumatobacteraceae bacterium]|jgi:hypothetical protein
MSTTFAPPSAPPAWGPPSPTGDNTDIGSTPDLPPSSGRRRPALLITAVVALIALGVGAFVALGDSSGDAGVTLPPAEAFDLAAAAQGTVDARTVEYDLTVTAGGLGGVTVSGALDNETKLATVSADMSTLLGLDGSLPIDGEIELLVDGANGVVYFGADALGGLLPADSAWISIDLAVLAERSGVSLDDLRSEFVVDPAASAQALLDADNAVELGTEEIDGVTVRHYEVTVDLAEAIAAAPQAAEQFDAELGELDAALPETVTYDVWVTEDNQLRRAAFDVTVADQTVSMVLDMTTSSEPLDLQVPADTFDVTSWLDW